MKKRIALCLAVALMAAAFAQEADDDFEIPLDEDFGSSDAVAQDAAPAQTSPGKLKGSVSMGFWVETYADAKSLTRDLKTLEDTGYEFDRLGLYSEANWWFWGDITPHFHLDAEVGAWKFDHAIYQAPTYASNVPDTTWGDGIQSLLAMPFSVFWNANDNQPGVFNKVAFSIITPYVNVKFGYGKPKQNGMAEFEGIYKTLDREEYVGKGFTEITNGAGARQFGNFTIDALAAFSMMRGKYGMYDFVDMKWGERVRAALTFGSVTTEDELFNYNKNYTNSFSAYASVDPAKFFRIEAHALCAYGTDVDLDASSTAVAGRLRYMSDGINVSAMQSFAGVNVNSVWGSDASWYDDDNIRKDTCATQFDFKWSSLPFIAVSLDETLTFADTANLGDGRMILRNQPIVDLEFKELSDFDIGLSLYAVVNVDRRAEGASFDRETKGYLKEAGVELRANGLARYLRKLSIDYAVSSNWDDDSWTAGGDHEYASFFHSIMTTSDITDNFNVTIGAIVRTYNADDDKNVPFGFAIGASWKNLPCSGHPMVYIHFTHGMDPYEDNMYSLYRRDDPQLKTLHRTYLLNSLDTATAESHVRVGIIFDLK